MCILTKAFCLLMCQICVDQKRYVIVCVLAFVFVLYLIQLYARLDIFKVISMCFALVHVLHWFVIQTLYVSRFALVHVLQWCHQGCIVCHRV